MNWNALLWRLAGAILQAAAGVLAEFMVAKATEREQVA